MTTSVQKSLLLLLMICFTHIMCYGVSPIQNNEFDRLGSVLIGQRTTDRTSLRMALETRFPRGTKMVLVRAAIAQAMNKLKQTGDEVFMHSIRSGKEMFSYRVTINGVGRKQIDVYFLEENDGVLDSVSVEVTLGV